MASIAAINNLGAYSHNPRGNLWFNDESTFGHKLLMKMGWQKGKGLGKNENGIKENLKVKFRNTNSGLGFKDDAYANVMKTEYESILKNLSSEYSHQKDPRVDGNIDKQQKSRVVRSRLRYPKLFFGKDVSKYTEKDMKSIFICSQPSRDSEDKVEDPIISHKKDSESDLSKSVDTHISDISISDYFAKKMEEKKNKTLNKNSSNDPDQQQTSIESVSPKAENFTFNSKTSSKRKRKILEIDISGEAVNDPDLHQDTLEFDDVKTKVSAASHNIKSSKKRKKNSEISTNELSVDSVHLIKSKSESRNFNKKNQKLLKNSVCENNVSDNGKIYEMEKTLNDYSCRSNKKKKKSQICENSYSSIDTAKILSENISPCETESSSISTKKKKKKKNRDKYSMAEKFSLQNPVSENYKKLAESSTVVNGHHSSVPVEDGLSNKDADCSKKKKQKKKLKKKLKSCLKTGRGSYSMKNVYFNDIVSYRNIDSDFECEDSMTGQSLVQDESSSEIREVDQSNTDAITLPVEDRSDKQNVNGDSCIGVLEEEPGDCSLSSLPSTESSHYNCWIESQRQALRMKMYKNILKSLKKHKVLRTTNMLSVKGYGNWGFK